MARTNTDRNVLVKFLQVVISLALVANTLMPVYHCHKPVIGPKMAIVWSGGRPEGELPLPLAFQYLISMIWRAWDLNLVMISSLALK